MAQVTILDIYNASPAAALSDGDLFEVQQGTGTTASKGGTCQLVREFVRAHLENNPLAVPYVAVSASKTLALTDAQTEQQVDAAATLTIPTNAAVAFDRGDKIAALSITTGTVTVTASAGVTLNGVAAGSASLSGQYSAAVLTKVGTDAWVINGDHGGVA